MLPYNNVSSILDIENIVPDNWDLWWNIWNNHKSPVYKTKTNHNRQSLNAEGLEIYKKYDDVSTEPYKFAYFNTETYFPKMFKSIKKIPMEVNSIIALSSLGHITPHRDFSFEKYSIRTMLYNNNLCDHTTFYYLIKNKLTHKLLYQKIPLDSNTWIYNDLHHHGSIYYRNYFKIILIYIGNIYVSEMKNMLDISKEKYKNYNLYFN